MDTSQPTAADQSEAISDDALTHARELLGAIKVHLDLRKSEPTLCLLAIAVNNILIEVGSAGACIPIPGADGDPSHYLRVAIVDEIPQELAQPEIITPGSIH